MKPGPAYALDLCKQMWGCTFIQDRTLAATSRPAHTPYACMQGGLRRAYIWAKQTCQDSTVTHGLWQCIPCVHASRCSYAQAKHSSSMKPRNKLHIHVNWARMLRSLGITTNSIWGSYIKALSYTSKFTCQNKLMHANYSWDVHMRKLSAYAATHRLTHARLNYVRLHACKLIWDQVSWDVLQAKQTCHND